MQFPPFGRDNLDGQLTGADHQGDDAPRERERHNRSLFVFRHLRVSRIMVWMILTSLSFRHSFSTSTNSCTLAAL